MNATPANGSPLSCVEKGLWTPVPRQPPATLDHYTLRLKEVDPAASEQIVQAETMTFHLVGCSGDFSDHRPQEAVAQAMAEQAHDAGTAGIPHGPAHPSSFLYHLGDVVYKDENVADPQGKDQATMYQEQFYTPFTHYPRSIFAIAGNHDGKFSKHTARSAIDHFLLNFCATTGGVSPDNTVDHRHAMRQPYVYWRLNTHLAYIIGLYSNVANGGMLDDPHDPGAHTQYDWLVEQLRDVRQKNTQNVPRRAVLLAVHYPPYSGATNFKERGDPTLVRVDDPEPGIETPTVPPAPANVSVPNAHPLATVLERAFQESGQIPDAVIAAHAHLYQRLTSRYGDGREVPYLIVGSSGHSPVENLWETCAKASDAPRALPFDAVLPPGLTLLPGQHVKVMAYSDESTGGQFGFLRLTIASGSTNRLVGEFFTAYPQPLALADSFTLDLDSHRIS